jgi:hypothetical protein
MKKLHIPVATRRRSKTKMVETKGTERDMIISKREKRTIVYNLK